VNGLASAWSAEPFVLAGAALAVALFAQGFVRLRRRGRRDHAPWSRALLFGAAVALGVLALVSPLDKVGEDYLLSGHMLQHMVIGDAVPALLLLALRGPLLFFVLPAAVLVRAARVRPLRRLLHVLLLPSVAFGLWVAVIAAWHVPMAYDWVLGNPVPHTFEHVTFFLAGLLVWSQLIDPARREALTPLRRLWYALGLFVAGTMLANVLIFSYQPLYPAYANQPDRLFGLSPIGDQDLAALVMMAEQALTLGLFAWLTVRAWDFAGRRSEPRHADTHPLAS